MVGYTSYILDEEYIFQTDMFILQMQLDYLRFLPF